VFNLNGHRLGIVLYVVAMLFYCCLNIQVSAGNMMERLKYSRYVSWRPFRLPFACLVNFFVC